MLTSIEKLGGNGLADQINHYNQYTGDPGYLPKDIARLRRVSAADVQRAARTWLPDARARWSMGVPGKPDLVADPAPAPPPPAARRARRPASTATKPWRRKPPKAGPPPKLHAAAGRALRAGQRPDRDPLPQPGAAAGLGPAGGGKSGSDANPPTSPAWPAIPRRCWKKARPRAAPRGIADEIAQLGAF